MIDWNTESWLYLTSHIIVISIICAIYNNYNKPKNFIFTLQMVAIITYFICIVFKAQELSLAMALGLFAVFSILQYRTVVIEIKPMTYIFIVIGLAMLNALSQKLVAYSALIYIYLLITAMTVVLEFALKPIPKNHKTTTVRIGEGELKLINSKNDEPLIQYLQELLNAKIVSYELNTVNTIEKFAKIKVKYETN